MYDIMTLENVSIEDITGTLNLAFSDYEIPFTYTPEQLKRRFRQGNVSLKWCIGAFSDGKLIGFILNAVDEYEGAETAFDVATGVVPEHRGKGAFTKMFAYMKEVFRAAGIKRYGLEVLTTNENAIRQYEKCGLKKRKYFRCFYGLPKNSTVTCAYAEKTLAEEDFENLKEMRVFSPSFERTDNAAKRGIASYHLYTEVNHKAFVICNPKNGEIVQLGYKPGDVAALTGILTEMANGFEKFRIINIDSKSAELIEALEQSGFDDYATQYEMSMEFSDI